MTTAPQTEQHARNKFTILTFFCSIFVIFIHANNLETYGITQDSTGIAHLTCLTETYWSKLISIAVPLFFTVSGILFFRTFELKKLFTKYKSRFFTIVIPYVIWCTIYYIYFILCTHIPFIKGLMNSTDVVEISFAAWINRLWVNEYYTLWFLKNLILFIAFTPFIWILLKNHIARIPTGFLVLLIILSGCLKITLPDGLSFYLIGSYIGINHREALFYKNRYLSFLCGAYVLFTLLTAFRYWNTGLQILFFISLWFTLDLFSVCGKHLPWWMSITFFTYVAHDIFLEAFEKIFLVVFGTKAIFALLDYILIPLTVEILLIGIACVMRKWCPWLWKILTGNRGI